MAKNYVNKESLRLEIIESLNQGQLTTGALTMLQLMIKKQQGSFKYIYSMDREDVRSHALEIILKKWNKYDPTKFNAFAYYTRMIYNGMYAGWHKLDKDRADFSLSNVFKESV